MLKYQFLHFFLVISFLKGNKMSLEQKAQILQAAAATTSGVRDLVETLNWKTSNVVSLLREMSNERLIEMQQATPSKPGRPKKYIVPTLLGLELLEAYGKMKILPLRARKEDLERAAKDALYACRLAANGHSTFQIFLELNAIVRNIRVSSQAH